ncbi:MAG: YopX family protein [Faecousia sp.]
MREILFRGKRLGNGEWVYGSFCIDALEQFNGLCGVDGFIRLYDKAKGKMQMYEVERETVGQCTGLKDKNGERIFEGDIVRCGTGRICKVTFFISPGVSGFDLVPIGFFEASPPYNWALFTDAEIIGNIHDNPELLEATHE